MAKRNYVIYSDESDKEGNVYSNFFGGVLLNAADREAISRRLEDKKAELGLTSELKWQRVTEQYLDEYKEFCSYFFSFVATRRLKVRIMFMQNTHKPGMLTADQQENAYLRLYYQFFKHHFGIKYCNPNNMDKVYFTLLLDQIPDSSAKFEDFKNFVTKIPHVRDMPVENVFIPRDHIAEVDSRRHVILQGLDIILGVMSAKLNKKFEEKPSGSRKRGKRTIAKEKLYQHINREIRHIHPNFNVGVSTGITDSMRDRWDHPYRHWNFRPKSGRN